VGGDYYDFIKISDSKILFILADISGKGVGASLIMVELRAIVRILAQTEQHLDVLLTKANHMLVDDTPSGTFVTLFAATIDTAEKTITYCNAGHNPPWLVKSDSVVELIEGGAILGFMKSLPFETKTIPIESGNKILIFTDGFSEGERADGEQLGEENLLEMFKNVTGSSQVQLDFLFDDLEKYVDGNEPSDDRTAIVIQCK